jgi:hypothetical protein
MLNAGAREVRFERVYSKIHGASSLLSLENV